jgi:LCP family protein required for cell wall assembly
MRETRFVFIAAVILLLVLSANGLYIVLYHANDIRYAPKPISDGYSGNDEHYGYYDDDYGSDGYSIDRMRADTDDREISDKRPGSDENSIDGTVPVNVLLLGLDRDKTRCDVIMLLNFDPAVPALNILSIARDTRIFTGRTYRKINSFYSRGGEKRVAKEVSRITGLPVHYYVTADFKGFRKIIDTLDGVEFYVPFRMNYDDPTQNLHIHLKKGLQLLDGKKAEQLVRYRKGNYKKQGYIEGDIGRIRMQQDFMKALIDQKLNFRYLSKVDDIFAILQDYVNTNITITDIARYAGSASKLGSGSIRTFVLPGESCMISNVWWYIYDRKETESMIEENFR